MELIKSMEMALATVPSPDNSQPWKYEWRSTVSGAELTIVYDGIWGLHALNAAGSGSLLALGFVLETVVLTGQAVGYSAQITLIDAALMRLNEGQMVPVARILFTASAPKVDSLYFVLPIRETNRGRFLRETPSEDLIRRLKQPQIKITTKSRFSVFRYLYATEYLSWRRPEIINAVFKTVKTGAEMLIARRGLNLNGLGLNAVERKFVSFLKSHPGFVRIFGRVLGLSAILRPLASQVFSASIFGCVTVRERTPHALVDAGRRTLRIWLTLNQAQYGFHPYCTGSIQIFEGRMSRAARRLRTTIGLEEREIPAVFFRAGKAMPIRQEQRALKESVRIAMVDSPHDRPIQPHSPAQRMDSKVRG